MMRSLKMRSRRTEIFEVFEAIIVTNTWIEWFLIFSADLPIWNTSSCWTVDSLTATLRKMMADASRPDVQGVSHRIGRLASACTNVPHYLVNSSFSFCVLQPAYHLDLLWYQLVSWLIYWFKSGDCCFFGMYFDQFPYNLHAFVAKAVGFTGSHLAPKNAQLPLRAARCGTVGAKGARGLIRFVHWSKQRPFVDCCCA